MKKIIVTLVILSFFLLVIGYFSFGKLRGIGKTLYIDIFKDFIDNEIILNVTNDQNKLLQTIDSKYVTELYWDKENKAYVLIVIEKDENVKTGLIFTKKGWQKFVKFINQANEDILEIDFDQF